MIDLDILEKRGITHKALKEWFQGDPHLTAERTSVDRTTPAGKRDELRDRIRLRIQAGRENNIANHRLYAALDKAWDVPFKQVTPTLIQTWMDKGITDETGVVRKDVLDTMKAWNFNPDDILMDVEDPKNPGKTIKQINYPAFFIIHVPIIKAYLTIRLAKLMNDRKLQPLFKYEPAINNMVTRLKCEVITNRIGDVMARQYGYWNTLRQAQFQALLYGYAMMFPVEEWHSEEQECESDYYGDDTAPPATNGETNGKKNEEGKVHKKVVKEGIRHHLPHPSRTFHDEAHRISSFLTDTGCEFGGYWRVFRYGDIRKNKAYWNTDKVSIGSTEWWASASVFWNQVYNSCTIKIPVVPSESSDREAKVADQFYTATMDDNSVVVTEYFEKLVPKDNGLGDYKYPVWFRFVVAGDDTILYAAPLPYCPIIPFLYDPDEGRTQEKNASLALEILPFQDHFSNLMTQYLLSVKQNLTNITAIDTSNFEDGKGLLKTLRNYGERLWRVINFAEFDGRKAAKSQAGIPQAFYSHRFPALNTQEIAGAMTMILQVLERVQQYSSQEVAQASSHELREKEVVNMQNATSTRLAYTAAPLDQGIEALKGQLYQGTMAFGQKEFYAQIPVDPTVTKEQLEEMGFTWDDTKHPRIPGDRKITVRVKDKRTAIALESFASAKDGPERVNDLQAAAQLLTALNQLLASPIGPAIGPEQGIQAVNYIFRMAGFPKEFQFDNMAGNPNQMQQIVQQAMQEINQKLQAMAQLDKIQQVDIEKVKAAVMQLYALSGTAPAIPLEDDQPSELPAIPRENNPVEEMAPIA